MPKKVTLKDIAAKAGLSPASVSMILNRRSIDRFNAETVEQVYAIAAELGYKQQGKSLRPRQALRYTDHYYLSFIIQSFLYYYYPGY